MRDFERADILVLGLGPAGASAAAEAARRGARVVALDRRREPGLPVQCAEFVPAMIGIDVGEIAASVRQPIRSMATFVEDDAPDLEENFPGHMLDRAAFDRALAEAAMRAGAQCRLGARVRRMTREGLVELSDGRAIAAKVLIGADGPRSLAGRASGRINAELVETRQITVPLRSPHEATDIFLSAGIPGGYGWLFPKGDVANLGAGVGSPHRHRLKRVVADLHAALVRSGRVGDRILGLTGGSIPVGGMLAPAAMTGDTLVLLAGDAAGLTNPVTGAGIAAAVHSGRLAGAAAAAHAAGDGAAAADYEDEMESLFRAALDRAVRRRRELAADFERQAIPGKAALRRAWIAYPEYWTR
jgi:geranylgeranyl reductase family protein